MFFPAGFDPLRILYPERIDCRMERPQDGNSGIAIASRYTQARIGTIHAPETTGKFVAATFEHDTARPVDGYAGPQLHTHAVIFNMTDRENSQTRALQERSLFSGRSDMRPASIAPSNS